MENKHTFRTGFMASERRILSALCLLLAALAMPALAAIPTLYWDLNGSVGGAGTTPTGIWDVSTANWNNNSGGSGSTGTWTGGDNAVFSAGTDATGPYTITLSGAQTANAVTFKNGVPTITGDGLVLTGAASITANSGIKGIISSVISGSAGVTKLAAGELVLQGANTFSGNLTNIAGTLTLDNDAAAGSGAIVLNPNAPAVLHSSQGLTTLGNNISMAGTSSTIDVVADANNTLVLNGVISGPHAWNASGAGTVVLGGSAGFNTFAGALLVANGTLVVAKDQALGSTVNGATVNSGATIAFSGGFEYTTAQGPKLITLNGPGVSGGAALNSLNGDNIFDGYVSMAADTIIGAAAGSSLVLNGPVTGTGLNLTKVGTGTLDLVGTGNNYNNTTVAGGILGVWGTTVAGLGTVTVNHGAALDGNGNVPGGVNLFGTIAPGSSPGSMNTGPETWNGGATYYWQISDVAGSAGGNPGWDLLNINGGLNIAANSGNPFKVLINSLDPSLLVPGEANFDNTQDYTFVIAHTSGGLNGFNTSSFQLDDSGFAAYTPEGFGKFVIDTANAGNDVVLKFVHPPFIVTQPSTATLQCGVDNLSLAVVAGGTTTLTYQWYKNSGLIPGATSSSLVISPATLSDSGDYYVQVMNSYGTTNSATVHATVQDTLPPQITCPAHVTVNANPGVCYATGVSLGTPTVIDQCGVLTYSNNAPAQFQVGDTIVVWSGVDTSGNVATCNQTVTVIDNQNPVAVAHPISVNLDSTGHYTLTPANIATISAGSTDNCSIASIVVNPNTFDCTKLGANSVTVTVTDSAGLQGTATTTVTVSDVTPPTVVANTIIVHLDSTGHYTLSAGDLSALSAGSIDSCSLGTTTATPSSFDCSNKGTNTVLMTVTDGSGNAASSNATVVVEDTVAPTVAFHSISVQLGSDGTYSLTAGDIATISAGSTDNCTSITNRTVTPGTFTVCDVGTKSVTLSVTDDSGNSASQTGDLTVLFPTNVPSVVYVSAAYSASCAPVSFPNAAGTFYVGYNAFNTIQAGVEAVVATGTVNVAAGAYTENVTVSKPLSLIGPNAGKSGVAPDRGPEAVVVPATADPENTPIISVEVPGVVVDGFVLDGYNASLDPVDGYWGSNGQPMLFAAAGVQNGVYPNLSNVSNLTIQNNIIRNVSYDGVYLDRIDFYTTPSTGNFILGNKFEDMWEGLLTYGLHSVIANNTFTNLNRGLSLHGTITDAGAFTPAVTNNNLIVAQWWPHEIARLRGIGIWINYRRENAAPLLVAGNTIETPAPAIPGTTIRGLEALTVDGQGTVTFAGNIVKGDGNCQQGVYAALCPVNNAVRVLGGSIINAQIGVLADTKDPDWGVGDAFITVSNATIQGPGGAIVGVLALQDSSTPANQARVNVIGNCAISGFNIGIGAQGANATASILNNSASITGNFYGVDVEDGKALIENNNLTGNNTAIHVLGAGLVDAGDCSGGNITGLSTGTGLGGSSAGLNILTGYGFDAAFPWAIQNLGTQPVLADANNFGALPTDNIARLFSGPVQYSQSGGAYIVCPATVTVQCVGNIPGPATTLADFVALGGYASANPGTITYSNYPATPLPGDQTVYRTYFITDACGQTASCTQSIIVHDVTPPTITIPTGFTHITISADPGVCNIVRAHVDLGTPSTSDNCAVDHTGNDAPLTFPLGDTTVTWTVYDINGISATASQLVTVVDTESPQITCPASILQDTDAGQCYATVTIAPATATDNCSVGAPVGTRSDSEPLTAHYPKGVTTIHWVATDASGNMNSCDQTITVTDHEAPQITGLSNLNDVPTDLNKCYATGVALGTPATTDNCGSVIVVSNNAPTQFPKGTTTVTWYAVDPSGNVGTATQLVTVNNHEAPVFAAAPSGLADFWAADGNATDAVGSHNGTVNGNATYAAGYIGQAFSFDGVNGDVDLGNWFTAQSFTIAFWVNPAASQAAAADIIDNNHTSTQNWAVEQDSASGNPNQYYWYDSSGAVTFVVPAGMWSHVAITRSSGNLNIVYVNGAEVGRTNTAAITYASPEFTIGSAAAGDRAWAGLVDDIKVWNRDLTAFEVLTVSQNGNGCVADISTNTTGACGQLVTFVTPNAVGNCDSVTTTQILGLPSGSVFPVGQTLNVFRAVDAAGNQTDCSFTVTVLDQENPTITAPADITRSTDAGLCTAGAINLGTPTTGDNCTVTNVSNDAPAIFPKGTTVVTWTVKDGSGNSATAQQSVNILDTEPPSISCPANIVQAVDAGQHYATVSFTIGYSDNCPGVGLVSSAHSGDQLSPGTNTVTATATDAAGLQNSCSFTVAVIDVPTIATQPASRTNNATTTATFQVTANSPASLTYHWYKNGTPLSDGGNVSGSATATLTIANVLATDAGSYTVVVGNMAGTTTSAAGILTVVDPAIFAQPANVTTNVSSAVAFSVGAAGTPTLSYQWYFGNAAIPGATASGYSIPSTVDSDAGSYKVVVTDPAGSITSAPALLVLTHPPVITQQPVNVTTNQGSTASFTVSVNGTTPFTYQWYKGVAAINGATNKKLVLTSVTAADDGSYLVAITNSDGYAISASATLTVIVPPAITTQPVGATNNAGTTISFTVVSTGSTPTYQWIKNGTNHLADSGNIRGANTATLTITNLLGADDGDYTVVLSNAAGTLTSDAATLLVIDPIITAQPADVTANLSSSVSFTVGAYGTTPTYQWRKSNTDIAGATTSAYTIATVADSDAGSYTVVISNAFGIVTSAPPATLTVKDPPTIVNGPASLTVNEGQPATFSVTVNGSAPFAYQWSKGLVPIAGATDSTYTIASANAADEADYSVLVTNVAGTITSSSAHLTVIIPPQITTQPVSLTKNAGQTAEFSVVATGTSPSYQWKKNGSDITGATTSMLTLNNVQDADVADYTVFVSNAAGNQLSTAAHLTVIDPPVITTQPASITKNAGQDANFTVVYTGTSPTFQWFKNGVPLSDNTHIAGSATASLTIYSVSDTDAANYTVTLNNAAGTVTTSPAATLTVIDPPVITLEPVSQTKNASTTATFTVAYTGTSPTFQWYKFGTNVLADSPQISGATSDTLTLTGVLAANAGDYTVVLANAAGSATSAVAKLTVIDPAILVQPVGQTNIVGSTITFSVTAAGTPTLMYQWKQNGSDLFGETDSTLTISNIADSDGGYYTVEVTGGAGSIVSEPAYLQTFSPLIVTQPGNITTDIGQPASFSVSVNGQTPFNYVWQKNGNPIAGATDRIFTIPAVAAADAGGYRVIVTNPNGSETSQPAVLTLITGQPQSLTQISNSTATFTVVVTGLPSTYQWRKGGSPISGATTSALVLNNIGAPDAGTYSVVINNSAGLATSSNATLAVVGQPTLTLVNYLTATHQPVLSVSGSSGYKYAIRATTNFVDWVNVFTNTAPYIVTDSSATTLEHRFYQAFWVP